MVCVLPGVADVRANDLRFISPLINDDFPTFDFPANAISGNVFSGYVLVIPHTVSSSRLRIIIRSLLSRVHAQVPLPFWILVLSQAPWLSLLTIPLHLFHSLQAQELSEYMHS